MNYTLKAESYDGEARLPVTISRNLTWGDALSYRNECRADADAFWVVWIEDEEGNEIDDGLFNGPVNA